MTVSTQPANPPFAGHPGRVRAVAVTPDGTQIITASADGTARIWDRASGQQVGPALTGHTGPRANRATTSAVRVGAPRRTAAARSSSSPADLFHHQARAARAAGWPGPCCSAPGPTSWPASQTRISAGRTTTVLVHGFAAVA